MRNYWIKTHSLVKRVFLKYIWDLPTDSKTVYLTFDDGPIPEVTQWVLDQLELYNAKATFFCIGSNVQDNPELFEVVKQRRHTIGNHTFTHVNGWKTSNSAYIKEVEACGELVDSRLFRPPYGKLTSAQSKLLLAKGMKIIMWDVLSADFDQSISPQQCLKNVVENIQPGSIIIFHDSQKAFKNLEYALPKTLQFLKDNGYESKAIGI